MTEEQAVAQEQGTIDLASFLQDFPGAPSVDQVSAWKTQYGEVFCSGFSELELFVWKPLSRKEYLSIQMNITSEVQNGKNTEPPEIMLERQIVDTCVLWGSELAMKALDMRAGTVPTLHEQIMLNSNFMNSAMAAALVVKL
jgi:hypothetical protein